MIANHKTFVSFIMVFLIFTLNEPYVISMTRQQLKSSGKLVKKACMPKNDVTEEQVGDISSGKFLEERNVMCYIACIYTVSQADNPAFTRKKLRPEVFELFIDAMKINFTQNEAKNNKIMHDAMIKQVDMMFPPELKDPVKETIEKCRGVAKKYKDLCEASYWTAKCMYDVDPANFIFP